MRLTEMAIKDIQKQEDGSVRIYAWIQGTDMPPLRTDEPDGTRAVVVDLTPGQAQAIADLLVMSGPWGCAYYGPTDFAED